MAKRSPKKSAKFAVITGASSGIGLELAKLFTKDGYDLLLVSDSEQIEEIPALLRREVKASRNTVETVQADLATTDGIDELVGTIETLGRPVDALVLNAGVGLGGDFVRDQELEDILNMVNLNVVGVVHLAKRLLPAMVERGEGKVLFTSSIAAMMAGTFEAVYGATKAFVQSFAQAIREEIQDSGVTVTCLQPGPTETNFFHRAGMDDTRIGSSKKDHPADVALDGYKAMMSGTDYVVAGSLKNKMFSTAGKLLPEKVSARLHRGLSEPGHGSGAPPKAERRSSAALPLIGVAALGATALFLLSRSEQMQSRFNS